MTTYSCEAFKAWPQFSPVYDLHERMMSGFVGEQISMITFQIEWMPNDWYRIVFPGAAPPPDKCTCICTCGARPPTPPATRICTCRENDTLDDPPEGIIAMSWGDWNKGYRILVSQSETEHISWGSRTYHEGTVIYSPIKTVPNASGRAITMAQHIEAVRAHLEAFKR